MLFCTLITLGGCTKERPHSLVEDVSGRERFSAFNLIVLRGQRDGDRFNVQAAFSDSASVLNLKMRFTVGAPTTLASGSWDWNRGDRLQSGSVIAHSVTFLGGQSGPPSIGGTFDLVDAGGSPRYRINLPVREVSSIRPAAH